MPAPELIPDAPKDDRELAAWARTATALYLAEIVKRREHRLCMNELRAKKIIR